MQKQKKIRTRNPSYAHIVMLRTVEQGKKKTKKADPYYVHISKICARLPTFLAPSNPIINLNIVCDVVPAVS